MEVLPNGSNHVTFCSVPTHLFPFESDCAFKDHISQLSPRTSHSPSLFSPLTINLLNAANNRWGQNIFTKAGFRFTVCVAWNKSTLYRTERGRQRGESTRILQPKRSATLCLNEKRCFITTCWPLTLRGGFHREQVTAPRVCVCALTKRYADDMLRAVLLMQVSVR